MYAAALRRILELYPAGISQEQILWRFKSSGLRANATDILQSFNELSTNGEVTTTPEQRWILTRFMASFVRGSAAGISNSEQQDNGDRTRLMAVPAICERIEDQENNDDPFASIGERANLGTLKLSNLWKPLLSYYAATQRSDPRGKIRQLEIGHGTSWQMFSTIGDWWAKSKLLFRADSLPETFREALTRRPERTCAVGYPLTVIDSPTGPEFLPALILSGRWELTDQHLIINIEPIDPVINPEWLKVVSRKVRRGAEDLEEAIFPEGESKDLDAVTRRMKNVLARFGGPGLVPARLEGMIGTTDDGLRNAAGNLSFS